MSSGLVIDRLPVWLLFVGAAAVVLAAWEFGYRIAAGRPRHPEGAEPFASEMIAAVLGLLAFLLAFTFSLASTRYQSRQDLAVQEVQAIRLAYLNANLIEEPDRTELRTALREYVHVGLDSLDTRAQLDRMLERSRAIQQRLVGIAAHVGRTAAASNVQANVAQQIDELVVLSYLRLEVGQRTRTPSAVVATLFLVILVVMLTIGWHAGEHGLRRRHAVRSLAVSFGVVLALISVLDRAKNSLVHENQHLMVELQAWIDAQPAP